MTLELVIKKETNVTPCKTFNCNIDGREIGITDEIFGFEINITGNDIAKKAKASRVITIRTNKKDEQLDLNVQVKTLMEFALDLLRFIYFGEGVFHEIQHAYIMDESINDSIKLDAKPNTSPFSNTTIFKYREYFSDGYVYFYNSFPNLKTGQYGLSSIDIMLTQEFYNKWKELFEKFNFQICSFFQISSDCSFHSDFRLAHLVELCESFAEYLSKIKNVNKRYASKEIIGRTVEFSCDGAKSKCDIEFKHKNGTHIEMECKKANSNCAPKIKDNKITKSLFSCTNTNCTCDIKTQGTLKTKILWLINYANCNLIFGSEKSLGVLCFDKKNKKDNKYKKSVLQKLVDVRNRFFHYKLDSDKIFPDEIIPIYMVKIHILLRTTILSMLGIMIDDDELKNAVSCSESFLGCVKFEDFLESLSDKSN